MDIQTMSSSRPQPLVLLAVAGFLVLLGYLLASQYYRSVVRRWDTIVSDVPEPVVYAVIALGIILIWVAMLVVIARALYWFWRQIDEYVLYAWDLLLPENPIIRFGVGITLMLFLFVFGPLLVIQHVDFLGDDDGIEAIESNETDPTPTPTPEESQSHERVIEYNPSQFAVTESVG